MLFGVIGGTGFYRLTDASEAERIGVETRYGPVCVEGTRLGDVEIAFLPRHGPGHHGNASRRRGPWPDGTALGFCAGLENRLANPRSYLMGVAYPTCSSFSQAVSRGPWPASGRRSSPRPGGDIAKISHTSS